MEWNVNPMDKKYLHDYIMSRIVRNHGCWEWRYPYPRMSIERKRYLVVAVLLWAKGRVDSPRTSRKMFYCHTCDNGLCIRPSHVFRDSPSGNSMDSVRKGRWGSSKKTSCKNGHPFTEANTYYVRDGVHVQRKCKACGRNQYRRKHKLPRKLWRVL